jgi:hypothetical protein
MSMMKAGVQEDEGFTAWQAGSSRMKASSDEGVQ